MRPRASFNQKPDGAFPFRLGRIAPCVSLAALALALILTAAPRLQAAPIEPAPDAGVATPKEAPTEDADPTLVPGLEETGEDPVEPDELDDNQVPRPDVKPGGEGESKPQSTEENCHAQ
jgi:hypothetical protein